MRNHIYDMFIRLKYVKSTKLNTTIYFNGKPESRFKYAKGLINYLKHMKTYFPIDYDLAKIKYKSEVKS